MKYLKSLNESKQVGILYHFTTLNSLLDLIKAKYYLTSDRSYISFTRNYDMKSSALRGDKRSVRIVINGDKLSNNYKLTPYIDNNYVTRNDGEMETRYIKSDKLLDHRSSSIYIGDCILEINIMNNPPPFDNDQDKSLHFFNFKPNEYINDYDKVKPIYNDYINKIIIANRGECNLKFVNQFKPYKKG